MPRLAAAYLRRSSVSSDSPGDASREAQRDATRRLASAFAPDAEVREYVDWGISGRKDDRPQYVALKADIAAGKVCCVFAYSLSRLGRTARELDSLFALCEAHDVQVITQADGTLTATSATGKFLRRILAELAELESELAKERSASARAAKRERGDVFGQPWYGYRHERVNGTIIRVKADEDAIGHVVEAFREAGTVLGAAALLMARGIPAPKGGRRWAASAVRRIIEREEPSLLPRKTATRTDAKGETVEGRRLAGRAILSGLVVCPGCQRTMTPNVRRHQLYCPNGPLDRERHTRYVARERDVLDFLKVELRRIDVLPDAVQVEVEADARRERIEGRLARARELFLAGDIDRTGFEREKAAAQREAEAIDASLAATSIAEIRSIDLDEMAPEDANEALRIIFESVTLDPDMKPTAATWRNPSWRRAS